ncbi:zinc finger CCCH domain-containing protein 34-like isoform X3 [Cucurbita pepo subsp. pepo]|uniref:zinc finger CCCH domain-containing protein 34-like isoform X3 n=1 Tax=Cucurbita pepo subsp. pepo TaxID=3664 RepID=UPI000C9D916B|nr:zinc finger CCCH domain-containing protein 34-like isoform X3 [Cucurbita pepo subsp. pepo]
MKPYGQSMEGSQSDPSPEWTASGPDTGHGEPVWPLGSRERESYPERPEEADCIYYLRTGFCGYGSRCRFNHPRERSAVLGGGSRPGGRDYPERVGQPLCQYYMRTGMCKFGTSCKYHHPQQEMGSLSPVSLNFYGYPLRQGEKECSYYLKNGQCKFGATCKFHHPEPAGLQFPVPSPVQVAPLPAPMPPAPSVYPPVQSPSAHSSQQYGVILARSPMLSSPYVPSPYGPIPYGPMLVSPGIVQFPSWNPYQAPMSPVASPSAQPSVGSGQLYGMAQVSPSAPAYAGSYQPMPSAGASSTSQKEHSFPERPGQPECQFYMRTGDCKFGSSCRYHHPPELVNSRSSVVLSQIGLPLRPGAPPCTHFMQRGICKFGPACKFDHSMERLSYSPSASSLADMPVAPYPVGSVVGTLAPSFSSSELRPEHFSGPRMDSNPSRMSSSMSTSSGLAGSTTSRTEMHSHSNVQRSSQSSGLSASSTSSTTSVEGRT